MAKVKQHRKREFLMVTKETPFQYQEAFKSLRTNLKFLMMDKACKTILMTSAIPGEGKSSVTINLALSLSEAGSRVLLIDCDLRKPIMHRYLKIRRGGKAGVTSVLAGTPLSQAITRVEDTQLDVLLSDAIPPNPAELLGSLRMKEMLAELSQHYDYILIDTPPVSVVTDAAVLSQYVDGVILVVRQNYATYDEVALAKRNLDAVQANLLGAVLNSFNTKDADKENGYYYSYNYNYSD